MNNLKSIFFILSLVLLTNMVSAQEDLSELKFLIGTWKVENKESYENWEKIGHSQYNGSVFKLNDSIKKIKETLALKLKNGNIVYEATVPDQNEGKTIAFELNHVADDTFSFENPTHDFPKKIQYIIIDKNKIRIKVLGDNDNGFSYLMIKQ